MGKGYYEQVADGFENRLHARVTRKIPCAVENERNSKVVNILLSFSRRWLQQWNRLKKNPFTSKFGPISPSSSSSRRSALYYYYYSGERRRRRRRRRRDIRHRAHRISTVRRRRRQRWCRVAGRRTETASTEDRTAAAAAAYML